MSGGGLTLETVSAGYGETVALEDVSLTLDAGMSLGIIGRNGVGKTTLLATIMGHTTLHRGRVLLGGADISSMPIFRRARAGIGYVPQEREIFPSLTVRENLDIAARPGRWTLDSVFSLFPQLSARAAHMGHQISGGERQMLAIARALVGNPRVLLMDEPTEGLAPVVVDELVRAMHALRDDHGLAIILVEQHAAIALDFSPRAVVMDRGRIVHDGPSDALKSDPARLEGLIGVTGG